MEKLHKKSKIVHDLMLVMTDWRLKMPITQGNIIMAEALNYCSYYEGLEIQGYLITKRRLFLIAYSNKLPFETVLKIYYYQVYKGIKEYYNDDVRQGYVEEYITEEDQPFKEYPLYNPYIRDTILGKQNTLPYYNTHQDYLEAQIKDYTYCSVKNYEGGKSPVTVNVKP